MPPETFELNYSKLRAYLDCPYLYRYTYVQGRYAPHNPWSSLGQTVHRALARWHANGGDLSDLLLYYDEFWQAKGYSTPGETLEFYEKGRDIMERWWAFAQERPQRALYFEKIFVFEFNGWRIRGTVDRIDRLSDGGHEVIDYKLGFDARPLAGLAAPTADNAALFRPPGPLEEDLQLALYAIGAREGLGLKVGSVSKFYLSRMEKVSIPYDGSRDAAVLTLVKETGEKILAGVCDRKGRCPSCPIRSLCPESEAK